MRIPRSVTYRIRRVLDEWLPPAIRDWRPFMRIPARILFGPKADLILDFKNRALGLDDDDFGAIYSEAHHIVIERETDLTPESLKAVLDAVTGETVLEVGCGQGHLAGLMSRAHDVTASDLVVDPSLAARLPGVKLVHASILELPFPDRSFDTVVCTHVLEHVQAIAAGTAELRRVCKKRLIIVVPCQRPYRYTFDLHLHFFPYDYTLLGAVNPVGQHTLRLLSGDWVYVEDLP
jgi:ubiquinone/menaquinone biosynthesis C-methylase UbiE